MHRMDDVLTDEPIHQADGLPVREDMACVLRYIIQDRLWEKEK
jgi:hypothetical protein